MNLQGFRTEYNALGPEYAWAVNVNGVLRATHPGVEELMCPIQAVLHARTGTRTYYKPAATSLGLTGKDRKRIVRAADNQQLGITQGRLRTEMLGKAQTEKI